MNILGIETATSNCSIAIASEDKMLGEFSCNVGMIHSSKLLPMIERLLLQLNFSIQDIGAIAVSKGPGSFTGLRVGMSLAKGLAFALNIPIIGIPTLEALAYQCLPTNLTICSMLDAKKKEIYTALYKWNKELIKITEEKAVSIDEIKDLVKENTLYIGDAINIFLEKIGHSRNIQIAPFDRCFPRASSVAILGLTKLKEGIADNIDELKPLYIRRPDAEIARL